MIIYDVTFLRFSRYFEVSCQWHVGSRCLVPRPYIDDISSHQPVVGHRQRVQGVDDEDDKYDDTKWHYL